MGRKWSYFLLALTAVYLGACVYNIVHKLNAGETVHSRDYRFFVTPLMVGGIVLYNLNRSGNPPKP